MHCGCRMAGGCLGWIWLLWTTSTCASASALCWLLACLDRVMCTPAPSAAVLLHKLSMATLVRQSTPGDACTGTLQE